MSLIFLTFKCPFLYFLDKDNVCMICIIIHGYYYHSCIIFISIIYVTICFLRNVIRLKLEILHEILNIVGKVKISCELNFFRSSLKSRNH